MVAKDLITQHCKKYGCNEEILKKELDESKDIKYYTDQYITMFDGLPDFLKCGLTVFSKIGISKAGIDRFEVLKKEEEPIDDIDKSINKVKKIVMEKHLKELIEKKNKVDLNELLSENAEKITGVYK